MLKQYVELLLILSVVCGAMVLSQQMDAKADQPDAAPLAAAQDKRDNAARHACPPGETVVWVSASAHECLREIQ